MTRCQCDNLIAVDEVDRMRQNDQAAARLAANAVTARSISATFRTSAAITAVPNCLPAVSAARKYAECTDRFASSSTTARTMSGASL